MPRYYGENPGEELKTKDGRLCIFEGYKVGVGRGYELHEDEAGYSRQTDNVVYDEYRVEGGFISFLDKEGFGNGGRDVTEDELEELLDEESYNKLTDAIGDW